MITQRANSKQLQYNLPQLVASLSKQKILNLEWGRGTGKSTFIGRRIKDLVEALPRASGVIVGETYQQILTRTLPSTIQGLEMHGFKKGLHYFVCRKPPKNWDWPEPYQPPLRYDYYIQFWNGTGMHLVSQDRPGSGRGLNTDFIIADEAALLDKKKLDTDVITTNRGNVQLFNKHWLHHSALYCSTTPLTLNGQWFIEMEEKAKANPKLAGFIRASAFDNIHNLGASYFEDCKMTMLPLLYNAEILNIRVKKIEAAFYPLLDEAKHTANYFDYSHYDNLEPDQVQEDCRGDLDLDKDKPIIAGMDFGDKINCLVTCQDKEDLNEFHFLKDFFVKNPKIIDDLADDYASYYKHHRKKVLYLWYDRHGNNQVANSKLTYAQQFKAALEKHGWTVVLQSATTGNNPQHQKKYLLWNKLLQEADQRYRRIRFNRSNCKTLLISMRNAQTRQGRNDMIHKDKRPETSKKGLREHKTDLSDAADYVLFGLFSDLLNTYQSYFYDTRIR